MLFARLEAAMNSEVGRYMTAIRRSPTRVLAIATTILALAALALALAPTALASSARSGALHIAKECSHFTGLAGSYCTITKSNLRAIPVGSNVIYFQAAPADPTAPQISDLAVVVGVGNYALGRVDLPGLTGVVKLSGGAGKFARFDARVVVTCEPPDAVICRWDGTYRFGEDN
jgi:hypothetical protein